MDSSEGSPQGDIDREAVQRTFERVQDLIKGANPQSPQKPTVGITREGGMNVMDSMGLIMSQEHLDLSEAQVGDVVWWRDEKEYPGYFLITKPYRGAGEKFQYGEGFIKAASEQGSVDGEKGSIEGAGFGAIALGRIAMNVPVKFAIPKPSEKSGYYQTHPVKAMGIIRAEAVR